jgi:hypothetical protein
MSEIKYTAEDAYKKYPYLKKLDRQDMIKMVTEFMVFMIRERSDNDNELHILNAIKTILETTKD